MSFKPNKFLSLFNSPQVWAAFIGCLVIVIKGSSQIFRGSEQIANIVYLLIAYIAGVASKIPARRRRTDCVSI
jgi:hypothetical protein